MTIIKVFFSVLFFMVSNAFASHLDSAELRKPVPFNFTHSLLGVSDPVVERLYSSCWRYQSEYFDITDLYGDGSKNIQHVGQYCYKREGDTIKILFGECFSIKKGAFARKRSLRFANLIAHAFSQSEVTRVNVYTFLQSEHVGLHVQFMEMQCTKNKDESINVKLKAVDSLSRSITHAKGRKIRDLFADQAFAERRIFLRGISHVTLGIQSCISFDCNVFSMAFLYIKATTDIDPEEVRNHKVLSDTMQLMVTSGTVKRAPTSFFDVLGHTTNLICYISKKIEAMEGYERAHPSILPLRFFKLGLCKGTTFAMKSTVSIADFVLSRIIRE